MTQQEIQSRMTELHKRRDVLEYEARQHEQAARDKRAEREQVKQDIEQLDKLQVTVSGLNQLQEAKAAAQQAQKHAETQAAAIQGELLQLQKSREETDALNAQLRERLAALDTKPENPAA